MWRYLREAFLARPEITGLGKVPVNVILLAGVGILGFGEHAVWLAGLGAEVAYLYACFTNERFRRWVDARNTVVEKTSAERQRQDLVNALVPPRREKLQKLQKRGDRILELYRQNQTDPLIVETNQHSLERMTWYYLKLLLAQQNLESLASETNAVELTHQIEALQKETTALSANANLRESKLATIRVLGKRPVRRVTFSPSANLTPRGASAIRSLLAGSPYFSLITASWPPMTLALPWSNRPVVTPPASAR